MKLAIENIKTASIDGSISTGWQPSNLSLPRYLAISLPRYLAISLPRCLAASIKPLPVNLPIGSICLQLIQRLLPLIDNGCRRVF